jgi:hypothetical protein
MVLTALDGSAEPGFAESVECWQTAVVAVGSLKMLLMRDAAVCVLIRRRHFVLHSCLDMRVCFAAQGLTSMDVVYVEALWYLVYSVGAVACAMYFGADV